TGFSAIVTWPVASTKRRNWALVTSVSSIQKPFTRTRWAGFSSGQPRSESVPIVNSPPGIQTMPGEPSVGVDAGLRLQVTRANVPPKEAAASKVSRTHLGRPRFAGPGASARTGSRAGLLVRAVSRAFLGEVRFME